MNKIHIFAVIAVAMAAFVVTKSQDSGVLTEDPEPVGVLGSSCRMENRKSCPSCFSRKNVTVDGTTCLCQRYRLGWIIRNIYKWANCTNNTSPPATTAAPASTTAVPTAAPTTPSTPSTTPDLVVDHERAVESEKHRGGRKRRRTRPARSTTPVADDDEESTTEA